MVTPRQNLRVVALVARLGMRLFTVVQLLQELMVVQFCQELTVVQLHLKLAVVQLCLELIVESFIWSLQWLNLWRPWQGI